MFAEPTINDHLTTIQLRFDDSIQRLGREVNRIKGEFTKAGSFRGSRLGIYVGEAARTEFRSAVSTVLDDLKRAVATTKLDRNELRDVTYQRLAIFALDMRAYSGLIQFVQTQHPAVATLEPIVQGLPGELNVMIRQFEVGFSHFSTQEVSTVTNNINVGGDVVGGIQQNTHNSIQNVSILDRHAIEAALSTAEQHLAEVSSTELEPIRADLATIRAQLKKPTLSESILRETGKTLRNLTENVAATALAPHVQAALLALAATLGAG